MDDLPANVTLTSNEARGVACQIIVEGLRIFVRVGLHPHEESAPQPVVFDGVFTYSSGFPSSDRYIDYDAYCTRLINYLAGRPHIRLLESLAAEIAAWSFVSYAEMEAVSITLHKPKIRKDTNRLCVRLTNSREAFERSRQPGDDR
ncbi:MAG TPA: dihydroneopterin aldolase [Trinickia sp.]|uniref:dihydroneopterin aldolase n=1 Tax=Trinickia sp. TaxID=2571163 RepID=UPI002F411B71